MHYAKRNLIPFGVILSLVSFVAGAYPAAGTCSGDCDGVRDPTVMQRQSDGKWFRFSTNDLIRISTADSIAGPWTKVGSVLVEKSVIDLPGNDDPWAPEIRYYKGRYWCFYSICKWGTRNASIGVAVSDTMEPGTWTDLGPVGITSVDGGTYLAIDEAFIETQDGKIYFSFGSYVQDIFLVELESPTKTKGEYKNIAYNQSGNHLLEGSYIYYHEHFYYLFISSGMCCFDYPNLPAQGEEYRIIVCRSADIEGPYVDAEGTSCLNGGGTTVLASHGTVYAPGGQGVYKDILYYHYVNLDVGYSAYWFGWNNIKWVNGWPTV